MILLQMDPDEGTYSRRWCRIEVLDEQEILDVHEALFWTDR